LSAVPDPLVAEARGNDEQQPASLAEVDHALSLMRDALSAHPLPRTFSKSAWTELLKRESEFVAELGLESIRLARQKRCDVVSASDVGEADGSIRRAGLTSLLVGLQTIGGVLAGAGVSGIIAVLGEKHPKGDLLALAGAGVVVGVALMMFTLGQSWPKWRR
jgi:hypothetical protein